MAHCQAARAQVSLASREGGNQSLRAKRIEARIYIRGAFAETRVLTTFQNEIAAQTEAAFTYVVPEGAVVTGFTYWFKGEKVVARIVEKERAAQIYRTITTRRRDPALIEQIDKTTFRARIFPIEANADLKIEMQWAQVLSSDSKGLLYNLPLKPAQSGKGVLENLDVEANVIPEANSQRVVNNYNLPTEEKNGARILRLAQQNYRPTQDLIVRLERPSRALQASLFAAASGGRDGFFVLALTPNQNLQNPRLQISGVQTYGVLPARLPNLKAHQSFLIVGRYRKSGTAQISLSGFGKNSAKQNVKFLGSRADNNLATKLWASSQIQELAPDIATAEKNRERIIQLSSRFTIPSPVTSWLAVPKSEWENFKAEIARADIQRIGPQLAELIAKGQRRSPQARRLRSQFDAACKITGENAQQSMQLYLRGLSSSANYEKSRSLRSQRYRLASQFIDELASKGRTPHVRVLEKRVQKIGEQLVELTDDEAERKMNLSSLAQSKMQRLIYRWAYEKRYGKSPQQLLLLQRQMTRLSSLAKVSSKEAQRQAMVEYISGGLHEIARQLATEISAGRGDEPKAKALRNSVLQSAARYGVATQTEKSLDDRIDSALQEKARTAASKWIEENNRFGAQPETAAALKAEFERLAKLTKVPVAELERQSEYNWVRDWQRSQNVALDLVKEKAKASPDAARVEYFQKTLEHIAQVRRAHYEDMGSTWKEYAKRESANNYFSQAEQGFYVYKVDAIWRALAVELRFKKPDESAIARLKAQLEKVQTTVSQNTREAFQKQYDRDDVAFYQVQNLLEAELAKPQPDAIRVANLEELFVRLQFFDWRPKRWNIEPQVYGKLRADRIKVRVAREKIDNRLKNKSVPLTAAEKKTLQATRAQLAEQENQLRSRMGDPLITVDAPEDAAQVLAILPSGEIKKMTWNSETKKWETRFDIPTYAEEGEYSIEVIVVDKDGNRQIFSMQFRVDVSAPNGKGKAILLRDENRLRQLRLEFFGDADIARVQAIMPHGEKIELAPSNENILPDKIAIEKSSTENSIRFFALAPLPAEYSDDVAQVEFIVTDRAHNRTSVVVDTSRNAEENQ